MCIPLCQLNYQVSRFCPAITGSLFYLFIYFAVSLDKSTQFPKDKYPKSPWQCNDPKIPQHQMSGFYTNLESTLSKQLFAYPVTKGKGAIFQCLMFTFSPTFVSSCEILEQRVVATEFDPSITETKPARLFSNNTGEGVALSVLADRSLWFGIKRHVLYKRDAFSFYSCYCSSHIYYIYHFSHSAQHRKKLESTYAVSEVSLV